jgi:hypothetical protein
MSYLQRTIGKLEISLARPRGPRPKVHHKRDSLARIEEAGGMGQAEEGGLHRRLPLDELQAGVGEGESALLAGADHGHAQVQQLGAHQHAAVGHRARPHHNLHVVHRVLGEDLHLASPGLGSHRGSGQCGNEDDGLCSLGQLSYKKRKKLILSHK